MPFSTHRFDYHRPQGIDEALRLRQEIAGSRFVAGGTDILVRLRRGTQKPPALISLRNVADLGGIEVSERTRIGGSTTIAQIAQDQRLEQRYPALVQAARRLGSPQIRNVATIGGNLCNASPCADTAPPLLIYGARAELMGPNVSREVPLDAFFSNPGETVRQGHEILSAIILDRPDPAGRSVFMKKSRVRMDLAQASVAVFLKTAGTDNKTCEQVRVAAGSVAPTPIRLRVVEEFLNGKALDQGTVEQAQKLAAEAVAPITDLRSTAEYRRAIVGVYVKRALWELRGGGQ